MNALRPLDERPGRRGLIDGWYRMTTPSFPSPVSGFPQGLQQEAIRRAQLASAVLLVEIVLVLAAVPEALFISRNRLILPGLVGVLIVQSIALIANRRGRIVWAGILCVAAIEGGLMFAILTSPGGIGVIELMQMALMVQAVYASVSLLPPKTAFLVAGLNCMFAFVALTMLPIKPELAPIIASDGPTLLVGMLSIQAIAAIITYLWVTSASQSLLRASFAEAEAALQQFLMQERRSI